MPSAALGYWGRMWLLLWLFSLVVVYPIPHTIALRNLLLFGGGGALLVSSRPARAIVSLRLDLAWMKPAGLMFAALAAWVVLQSAFISLFPDRALASLTGSGLATLLVFLTGVGAARREPRLALQALALALTAHMATLLLYQGYLKSMEIPALGVTPFGGRDYHSLLNGSLLALLLADRVASFRTGGSPLGFRPAIVWAMLALSLVADVTLWTRNGTVVTAILVLAGGWLSAKATAKRWMVLALVVSSVIIGFSVSNDLRWQDARDSIQAGLSSTDPFRPDLSSPLPTTAAGRPVETSAYLRALWAREAVAAIVEHPLGLGFGHQAFGWAIEMKYGYQGMESSHSGWLDFALANGVPGLALWLALSLWLIRAGWRRFRMNGDGTGILLSFSVFAYLLRCLLDGHLSGWRLAMYALTVGLLIGTMSKRQSFT